MKTFRFLEFPVYKESKDFFRLSVTLAHPFTRPYWDLGDQFRRAALSISLNIAEGSAKYSDKDFKRFVENALGSVSECTACLDIAKDHHLISEKQYLDGVARAESIARQLGGLSKKLRSSFG